MPKTTDWFRLSNMCRVLSEKSCDRICCTRGSRLGNKQVFTVRAGCAGGARESLPLGPNDNALHNDDNERYTSRLRPVAASHDVG